jgi:uncharacterized protein YqjF (DUF2071 family)
MSGKFPEERVTCPVARQEWRTMTFVHWRYDPSALRPLVPEPFEPDTWEGEAWVSLTPFEMANFRLGPAPAALGMTFPETNLRTYVRDEDGRDGLWFLSLEADNLLTVVGANTLYGVPYRWAEMSVEEAPTVRYVSHRRVGAPVGHDIVVRPGEPCGDAVTDLDHWLTGRWRAHTRIAGRPTTVPVEHEPWPLWNATLVGIEESLLAASGLPQPADAPLVHYSPGVSDVRLGAPHPRW